MDRVHSFMNVRKKRESNSIVYLTPVSKSTRRVNILGTENIRFPNREKGVC